MNLKYLAGVGLLAVGVGAAGVVTVVGTPGGASSVTYQTAQATTTNVTQSAVASGAGLGLAIADSVVRATGGRWRVATSAVGGASMAVTWPRGLADESPSA